MTIENMVREDVVAVSTDAGVHRMAGLMDEHAVGSVVVAEEDRPVGLVTDRDLTLEVLSRGGDAGTLTASDVMSVEPFTVSEDAGIYEVLASASEVGVRRVPTVDEEGDLAGIVTLDDFLVLLAGELDNVADIVRSESPPY